MFQQILDKYNAKFSYDEIAKTWCLYGTTPDGVAWETDDYDAETREQAENDAAEYLETNNAD